VSESAGSHDGPVVRVEERGEGVIVRLAGELDLYNAHVVRDTLLDVASSDPERLIVDLSEVMFVDSTALGALIEARSRLANRRSFLLVGPGVETQRALEVSGLDKHFGRPEVRGRFAPPPRTVSKAARLQRKQTRCGRAAGPSTPRPREARSTSRGEVRASSFYATCGRCRSSAGEPRRPRRRRSSSPAPPARTSAGSGSS